MYSNIGVRTSVALTNIRNTGLFDKYFCDCIEINDLFFIHSSQVKSKCLGKLNNNKIESLSELELINPHD